MASAAVRSGYLMADFNYFLLQIANEIKSDELAEMKFLCDLPRGKLEQITNPTELLNILKRSDKIRPGEVMYLVTLLERVGLVKLAGEVMEQGKTSKLLFTLKRLSLLEVMWSWNDLNVEFLYLILCCNARSIVTLACFFQLEYLITANSIQKLIPQSPTL